MKTILLMLLLAAAFFTASAGEIFGTLSEGDKPLPAGVKVEVTAGGKTYSAQTDSFGGYRIFVKEKGKCSLKVLHKSQAPVFEMVSFDKSMRYDFVLMEKDGVFALQRK